MNIMATLNKGLIILNLKRAFDLIEDRAVDNKLLKVLNMKTMAYI